MPRDTILQSKNREQRERDNVPFITEFNTQYKILEGIVKKNWTIICNDPHLNKILPSKPTFIYRRARRIRDGIVKNLPDPPPKIITAGLIRAGLEEFEPMKRSITQQNLLDIQIKYDETARVECGTRH